MTRESEQERGTDRQQYKRTISLGINEKGEQTGTSELTAIISLISKSEIDGPSSSRKLSSDTDSEEDTIV